MGSIYKFYNQVEASRLKDVLDSNNIPTEIHSFENWSLDGVLRPAIGMGEIIVPDTLEKEAKEIIKDFMKQSKGQIYHKVEVPRLKIKKKRFGVVITILIYVLPLFGLGISMIVNFFNNFIAIFFGWICILAGLALLYYSLKNTFSGTSNYE